MKKLRQWSTLKIAAFKHKKRENGEETPRGENSDALEMSSDNSPTTTEASSTQPPPENEASSPQTAGGDDSAASEILVVKEPLPSVDSADAPNSEHSSANDTHSHSPAAASPLAPQLLTENKTKDIIKRLSVMKKAVRASSMSSTNGTASPLASPKLSSEDPISKAVVRMFNIQVPASLLVSIINYTTADYVEIVTQLALVCKSFHIATEQNSVWRNIIQSYNGPYPKQISALLSQSETKSLKWAFIFVFESHSGKDTDSNTQSYDRRDSTATRDDDDDMDYYSSARRHNSVRRFGNSSNSATAIDADAIVEDDDSEGNNNETNPDSPASSSTPTATAATAAATATSPTSTPTSPAATEPSKRPEIKKKPLEELNMDEYYSRDVRDLIYLYQEEPDTDEYIEWDDEVNPTTNETVRVIKCATLNKLIEYLTSTTYYDNHYLHTIMLTYRSITKSDILFEKLVDRFNIPPPKHIIESRDGFAFAEWKKNVLDKVRVRVTQTMKYWLENHFYDWDEHMLSGLQDFIERTMMRSKAEALSKLLKNALAKAQSETEARTKINLTCPPSITPKGFKPNKMIPILDWSSVEIARQLTLIDYNIFKQIRPKECLNQAWNKGHRETKAPNISAMIQRFNKVSNWVGTQVVKEEKEKKRAALIAKFVEVAQACYSLNNFNAIYAVISGLNLASVHRLRKSWDLLKESERNDYEEMFALINRDKNFRNIRTRIRQVSAPCIPYIGLYLTDLTFIEDGCPKLINDKFNFIKCSKFAMVIRDLQTYQTTPYALADVTELSDQLINNLEIYEEAEMYRLSLLREPRVSKKVSTSS